MIRSSLFRLAVVVGCAASMSACALLSSPDPVQTYRFGGMPGTRATSAAGAPVNVLLRRIDFPQATEGSKLLGVTGSETAYIKGARWVSDARDLYTASLESAFGEQSQRVRLLGAREQTPAQRSLAIEMRAFEVRYPAPGAAPTVVLTARVRMLGMPDRAVTAEQVFTVEQPASANRVSAIVDAFDIATRDLNTQIVAWTDRSVG